MTAPFVNTLRALDSNVTTGNAGSIVDTSLTAGTTKPAYDTATNSSCQYVNCGIKMPKYKSTGDIETLASRFEKFCLAHNVDEAKKANLILSALDNASFKVVLTILCIAFILCFHK